MDYRENLIPCNANVSVPQKVKRRLISQVFGKEDKRHITHCKWLHTTGIRAVWILSFQIRNGKLSTVTELKIIEEWNQKKKEASK